MKRPNVPSSSHHEKIDGIDNDQKLKEKNEKISKKNEEEIQFQLNKTIINNRKKSNKKNDSTDYLGLFLFILLVLITVIMKPDFNQKVSVFHVFYYGWITGK
jgi:hypothetical protein